MMQEVGRYDRENFGEDPWSSGESEQQDPVLEVLMAHRESQELLWVELITM